MVRTAAAIDCTDQSKHERLQWNNISHVEDTVSSAFLPAILHCFTEYDAVQEYLTPEVGSVAWGGSKDHWPLCSAADCHNIAKSDSKATPMKHCAAAKKHRMEP
jgi:hypothetical protein